MGTKEQQPHNVLMHRKTINHNALTTPLGTHHWAITEIYNVPVPTSYLDVTLLDMTL